MRKILLVIFIILSFLTNAYSLSIEPGAERTSLYLHLLKNKRVGLFVNQTSLIGHTHLVDYLRKQGITITKIFTPEHGLQGNEDDGTVIGNSMGATGIPIVSLYGKKFKPTA